MGQQVLVFCLYLLCIRCGLAQYVTSSTTSHVISSTETSSLSGLYNMANNSLPDYTLNETRAGMATVSLDALHNISVPNADVVAVNPHGDLFTAIENNSDTLNGLEITSVSFVTESNSTENKSKNTFDETLKENSSKLKIQYPIIMMSNKSSHKHVPQLEMTTIINNYVNSSGEEISSTGMSYVQPIINDTSQTNTLHNDTNVNTSNTTDGILDIPLLSFIENITSGVEFGNEVKQTLDSVNVSKSAKTQSENITTDFSSSSVNEVKLPEIKWRHGMRQPQTISDLIRVTGADIKFITTQFGGNFSVNGNESHTLEENEQTITEVKATTEGIHDVKMKAVDKQDLISNNKSSPIQHDGLIKIDEIQTPQLSNIKVNKVMAVSSGPTPEEDDSLNRNMLNIQSMKSDGTPRIMKVEDGFLAPKTLNDINPDVMVRNTDNDESSYLNFVPNINNRNDDPQRVLELTFNGLNRQNNDRSIRGNGWINPTRQSETPSRRLISFGNNPEYVIGTGSSVQIPQSIVQNHLPNAEPLEIRGNRRNNDIARRRGNTELTETGMNSRMNRFTPITRAHVEDTMPIFSEMTRFRTSRGMARSENLRSDTPRAVNFPVGSMQGNQERVGRLAMIDRSSRFTPGRNDFRSTANVLSFDNIPADRRLDNRVRVSERNQVMPSFAFRNNIPGEVRQSIGTSSRDTNPVEFSRRRTFDSRSGGTSFVNQRGNLISRNTEVAREFIRPRQFDRGFISRSRVTDRPFPRDDVAFGFRDGIIRPRLSRAEVVPIFTAFRGVGPAMFAVDTGTFGAPIRPSSLLSRTVLMPTGIFTPFPRRTPFPFF